MSIIDILQLTVFVIRLILAVALASYALKTKGTNFWWLFGLYFISVIIGFNDHFIGIVDIFALFSGFRFICMVLFIHYTFYLDRSNPTIYFFIISVIAGILIIIFKVIYDYIIPLEAYNTIARITQMIGNLLVLSWLIYSSYLAFQNVKNDDTVDDWVKMRYKLVILYPFFGIFVAIAYGTFTTSPTIAIFLATIVFQIIQLIAWVMPKPVRKFFNRHFTPGKKIDDLSEEEINNKMKGD